MTQFEWALSTFEFIMGSIITMPITIYVYKRKEDFIDVFKIIIEIFEIIKKESIKRFKQHWHNYWQEFKEDYKKSR